MRSHRHHHRRFHHGPGLLDLAFGIGHTARIIDYELSRPFYVPPPPPPPYIPFVVPVGPIIPPPPPPPMVVDPILTGMPLIDEPPMTIDPILYNMNPIGPYPPMTRDPILNNMPNNQIINYPQKVNIPPPGYTPMMPNNPKINEKKDMPISSGDLKGNINNDDDSVSSYSDEENGSSNYKDQYGNIYQNQQQIINIHHKINSNKILIVNILLKIHHKCLHLHKINFNNKCLLNN